MEAWRRVGLEPVVVFDGEYSWLGHAETLGTAPAEKHKTIIARLERAFSNAGLFYTTSVESRSRPSFSRSEAILPPFALHTFIHALNTLNVKSHHTADGEADGITVALAHDLGAYILGNDSDFLIFLAGPGADNVKGYCPLDFLEWRDKAPPEPEPAGEWTVAASRKPLTIRQSPYLPPPNASSPSLLLGIITLTALRQRFRIPPPHFALLASLVGNDYVPHTYTYDLFGPRLNSAFNRGNEKIELVARIIREAHYGPTAIKERQANAGDQAVFFITKVVERLIAEAGTHVPQAGIAEMVETIIEATLQYVLPSTQDCCKTFPFCGGLLDSGCQADLSPRGEPTLAQKAYAAAHATGYTNSVARWYSSPDRVYLFTVVEDPSEPSAFASERLCGIRKQSYTIAEAALGEFAWPDPTEEEIAAVKEDQEVKALLRVEVASDCSSEHNEQQDSEETTLVEDQDGKSWASETCIPETIPPSRTLVEYIRQSSAYRLTGYRVLLPPRPDELVTPESLEPLDFRIRIFLAAFSSDTPTVLALPRQFHPLVAALRVCILESFDRSGPRGSTWRKVELEAVLRACIGTFAGWTNDLKTYRPKRDSEEGQYPPLETRSAKIVGQLTAVMIHGHVLAQSLLLVPAAGDAGQLTHLSPFMFLSGVAIHTCLAGVDPPPSTGWTWSPAEDDVYTRCLAAIADGFEDKITGWRIPETQSSEKTVGQGLEVEMEALEVHSGKKKKRKGGAKGGSGTRFDLLLDAVVDA